MNEVDITEYEYISATCNECNKKIIVEKGLWVKGGAFECKCGSDDFTKD